MRYTLTLIRCKLTLTGQVGVAVRVGVMCYGDGGVMNKLDRSGTRLEVRRSTCDNALTPSPPQPTDLWIPQSCFDFRDTTPQRSTNLSIPPPPPLPRLRRIPRHSSSPHTHHWHPDIRKHLSCAFTRRGWTLGSFGQAGVVSRSSAQDYIPRYVRSSSSHPDLQNRASLPHPTHPLSARP